MDEHSETVDVDFVAPRYLAGGGDPAWITVPLHRACGWSHGHDPLMPRVILSSPDQKALLRLEPDPDGQWWTLQHAATKDRPAWYASFGAHTPVEFIAAFTDALTAPTADAPDAWDPMAPLYEAGWSPAFHHDRLGSPDGTVRVELDQASGAWRVTTALDHYRRPLWQAHFGEHTPPSLITAFTTALADPNPVARTNSASRLPTPDPGLVTRRTTSVRAVLIATALEDRVRTLAARRADPPDSAPPPAQPPAKNSRSR
ncbi:DUF317 domain-containing protein [Streptomyces sp. NPDC004690]